MINLCLIDAKIFVFSLSRFWIFFWPKFNYSVTYYTAFLQEVWEKKPEIEQAFHMEEPVTLDSGEGTLEHSTHHRPQPPPRHESYLMKNADGSGSENYEHLPTRSLNSLNGVDDNNINFNLNDNNEKYPHLYMLGDKDMGIDDTYMNDDDKDDKSRLIHQGNAFLVILFSFFAVFDFLHSLRSAPFIGDIALMTRQIHSSWIQIHFSHS